MIDASVIVKWFVEEENSSKAMEIRDRYISGELRLIAPEIIIFEVLNALYYKNLFSEDEIKEIGEALQSYSIELYSLEGEYRDKTIEVAFKNRITIYDAAYIGLAVVKGAFVYTADEKLKNKLTKEYKQYIRTLNEKEQSPGG